MNPQQRPPWMPDLSKLERDCITALVATVFVALVVRNVPALRALVTKF